MGGGDGGPRVLVVCTGNLCRSPLAAALLARDLDRAGIVATIESAGLAAPMGRPPDRKLRRVAAELEVDVNEHLSTPITPEHLRWAELILAMTGEQTAQVRSLDPQTERRSATLRAAAWRARLLAPQDVTFGDWVELLTSDVPAAERAKHDAAYDIADPIGGPLRAYRAMGDEVRRLVQNLVDRWSGR